MKNEETKVMNALVSLQVCPRVRGESDCCKVCTFVGTDDCSAKLVSRCMEVLEGHIMHGNAVIASSAPDYEGYITDMIREIGIPAHIKGYRYVRHAIILAAKDHEYVECITSRLYPDVARAFDTTSSRVERAIRHSIEVAWDRCDLDVLMEYFGNTVCSNRGRPTNSEFIATMAEHVNKHFNNSSFK